MTGLERFIEAKRAEISALERLEREDASFAAGGPLCPWPGERPSFLSALEGQAPGPLAVIAEFKQASPSRGVICEGLTPEDVARQYAENGASALSVLTEEAYFKGDISFLARIAALMAGGKAGRGEAGGGSADGAGQGGACGFAPCIPRCRTLPMLRKDFLFHPAQIAATLATPASALLLIVRLTPDARILRGLREQAEAGGVQAVVEVFDEADLRLARESGARIIQVNARDLATLKVDRSAVLRLIRECPPQAGERWIAASGMASRADLVRAAGAGYSAALVGSALMEHGTPGADLRRMLTGQG